LLYNLSSQVREKSMVPHLVTALNGPLLDLERKILDATPFKV